MSYLFSKASAATGPQAMFNWKDLLVSSSNWIVPSSSDGTTYNSIGDQITSGSSGANGLANNNAWIRVQSPNGSGNVEWIIQRGSSNTAWRIKYSMSAGFVGGSPSATQTPSATDEVPFWGGGTDASPTFGTLFATDGSYRWNVASDNATPFGFWCGGFPAGGGNPTTAFVFDPLEQPVAGDASQFAIYVSGTNPFQTLSLSTETMSTTTNQLWSSVPAAVPAASDWKFFSALGLYVLDGNLVTVPNGLPTNPLTAKDEVFPIVIGRRAAIATGGYKGVLSQMRWTGTSRSTGDTLSVGSTRDRIVYGSISFNWDGTVPTV